MINPSVFFARYLLKAVAVLSSLVLNKASLVWDEAAKARVDYYAAQAAEVIGEILNRSTANPLVHMEAFYRWLCEYRDSLPAERPLPPRLNEIDD